MADIDPQLISNSIRILLEENDQELAYWGAAMSAKVPAKKELPEPVSLQSLEELRVNVIGDCQRCPLASTRTKLVFGVGNPQANVMFIGEGPGFDEDRQGEPFVGKAGQLLDKIMAAIGLNRQQVYIANIVKCHPMVDPSRPDMRGNDRPPNPEEMEQCRPFLLQQIALIKPRFIVALGATATRALLNTRDGITKLRGAWIQAALLPGLSPIAVMPTYHPAALLRNPDLKRDVWTDMKELRDQLSKLS